MQLIPRSPLKIDARSLHEKLTEAGYETTKRSIERDLNMLSGVFPIKCDDRSKPYGWSWMRDSHVDIPGMDLQMALTFGMVKHFMPPLLPASSLNYLSPYFKQAEKTLSSTTRSNMGSWIDKVRVLGRGLQLQAPQVKTEVMDAVYEALLNNKRLAIKYLPRNADDPTEYEVNPLGLVVRNAVIYIVCSLWEYDDIKQLVMHRIKDASVLDTERRVPEGFELDAYIKGGAFSVPVDEKPIKLKVLFDQAAAFHLHETPLSDDQRINKHPDGRMMVSATVVNSQELRWWLLAFGDQVEIVSPKGLRDTFADILKQASKQYKA